MPVKVVFIGNFVAGDDGIGPFLFEKLKDDKRLKDFELLELGVIGFDLISYVGDGDRLIIVDAVRSENNFGDVVRLKEINLSKDLKLISQHDFGVEQTATILRSHYPKIKSIDVVGIRVKQPKAFTVRLTPTLMDRIPEIKEKVVELILEISKES
jgi:hydrogenase maturation protease